jgi:molecular chaperone Hsp33
MLDTPVRFTCDCSRERALTTLENLGVDEVQQIVDTLGSTAVTCQFCGTKHEISLPDLWAMLERLGRPQLKH